MKTLVAALIGAVLLPTLAAAAPPAPPAPATVPSTDVASVPTSPPPIAIAVIEWRIKKGHEQEFLDYWGTKSTIPNRTGLVGEFLSGERDALGQFPWVNWPTRTSPDYTVYYNVGIWSSSADYVREIGRFADNARPPMPFEYDHRRRVIVEPFEWRRGPAALPVSDAPGVR